MLIRLSPMITNRGVFPISAVEIGIGRGRHFATDAQQRAEGIERVEAPIEAERKFVEVGLQMLGADAVVAPAKPAFEVAEHEVDDGQVFLRHLRPIALDHGKVLEASVSQARVAGCAIRDDHGARHDCIVNEADEGASALVRHHFQPEAASVAAASALFLAVVGPLADFHGGDDECLIVLPFALATGHAADPRLINLDMYLEGKTIPPGWHRQGTHEGKTSLVKTGDHTAYDGWCSVVWNPPAPVELAAIYGSAPAPSVTT